MNEHNRYAECVSSLWLHNLVNNLSGMTIKAKQAVFCGASPFQKIEVFDTYSFGHVLCLGGTIVMTELEETYHEMMVHPALLMHRKPSTICCIGGGDGSCLKEILKHSVVEKVVIVEIDQLVQETITTYFPAFGAGFADPRVELVIDDGYHFLKNNERVFDIILVDSYDPAGPVQSLETADFHQIVAERLEKEGIAVFQTDSPFTRPQFFRETLQDVSTSFIGARPYICPVKTFPDGLCSFLACACSNDILDSFDQKRYSEIASLCSYYNSDVHRGAFLLPENIKRLLRG
jgi:spermidine synthase